MTRGFDEKKIRRRIDRIQRMSNVRRILHDLDIQFKEKQHGDLWFKCVIPTHKDKDASAHLCALLGHEKHGIWNCFGCETSGDIIELIRQQLGFSLHEAILWAEARVHLEEVVYQLDKEKIQPPALPKEYQSPIYMQQWPHEYIDYLVGRGVDWYQIFNYGIGYCNSGKYAGRIIVPVSLGSQLRTWVGRNISSKGQRITSCKGGLPGLFGSQFASPSNGPAILTEGWADALRVNRAGYPNTMAIQTNKLHEEQLNYLKPYEYIIIMPDGDEGGDNLVNALSEHIHKKEFFVARVPMGIDPGDATNEQIDHAIQMMKPWKPVVRRTNIEIVY